MKCFRSDQGGVPWNCGPKRGEKNLTGAWNEERMFQLLGGAGPSVAAKRTRNRSGKDLGKTKIAGRASTSALHAEDQKKRFVTGGEKRKKSRKNMCIVKKTRNNSRREHRPYGRAVAWPSRCGREKQVGQPRHDENQRRTAFQM